MNIEAIVTKFKDKPGFRETPVRNFLGTLGEMSKMDAMANLAMDARLYSWKPSIVAAIKAGITAKFKN